MKSSELKNLKKVPLKKKKKVLLINSKRRLANYSIPHNGLAILGTILKKRGHDVLIIDYVFIHENINISHFIEKFNPDVIGISSYTVGIEELNNMISRVYKTVPNIPLIVGGPHATLYSDFLEKDKRIDYISVGEAELTIIKMVENAKKENMPKIIRSREIVNLNDIPPPDYSIFYKWKLIRRYSILTSRGCPHNCSFCTVRLIMPCKWRERKVELCIEELELAKKNISDNMHIIISDDSPMTNKIRFKNFLKMYAEKINMPLTIVNTRADTIDEEILTLLKKCGCKDVGLGVEHAHPKVFELINKAETLEQIEKSARLIKKYGMRLQLSFIIGLPRDNLERTKTSIKFANKLKADFCGWSFITPYRNTPVREWFDKNGKVFSELGYDHLVGEQFELQEPRAETRDFTIQERKKAHYMCIFRTKGYPCKLNNISKALFIALKYNLLPDFFYWFPRGILMNIEGKKDTIKKVMFFYKKEGLLSLLRKIIYILNSKKR